MPWTKIPNAYSGTSSAGWGEMAWGDDPWGGASGSQWIKVSASSDTWTKVEEAE